MFNQIDYTNDTLPKFKVSRLKQICRSLNLNRISNLKKGDLISMIREHHQWTAPMDEARLREPFDQQLNISDLGSYSLKVLKNYCKDLNLAGYSNKNKLDVIRMLHEYFDYEAPELECAICTDSSHRLFKLPCNHEFHYKCLKKWVKKNTSCPMCRCSILNKMETLQDISIDLLELLPQNEQNIYIDHIYQSDKQQIISKLLSHQKFGYILRRKDKERRHAYNQIVSCFKKITARDSQNLISELYQIQFARLMH